jgi:hypothetical protein
MVRLNRRARCRVVPPGYGHFMGPSTQSQSAVDPAWDAAALLAAQIASSGVLPVLASPLPLDIGEVLHASGMAEGCRFHGIEVTFEQRRLIACGGPITFGIAAAATTAGNRRARAEAERLAAPQWRPLGHIPILATNQRLLILHEGIWASVWYSAIRHLVPHLDGHRLELIFDDDPPYALQGEWVPYLAVVLTAALAEQRGLEAMSGVVRTLA